MSFGISVSDFITVGKLINDIVTTLQASSRNEYQELILELHGLNRALHDIEHLRCNPSQEIAVNGIKVAALMCQHALDEFTGKLKKFQRLAHSPDQKLPRLEWLKLWAKKMQWGFCMKEEVEKL